jgi:hypothetical protein
MYEYDLAIYFWSTLLVFGLVAPFVVAVAREAVNTIEQLHHDGDDHGAPPSLRSVPIPSRPSGC